MLNLGSHIKGQSTIDRHNNFKNKPMPATPLLLATVMKWYFQEGW